MSTTSSVPFILQLVTIIFMIGAVWWAILLLKDSSKHKKFAKVIRIIAGAIQLLSIIWSIIIVSIISLNPQLLASLQSLTSRTGLGIVIIIIGVIVIISFITNIRWGILLCKESAKNTWSKKWIRIICGIIMIIALSLSFIISIF